MAVSIRKALAMGQKPDTGCKGGGTPVKYGCGGKVKKACGGRVKKK